MLHEPTLSLPAGFPFTEPAAWQKLKTGLRQLAQSELLPRFRHVEATRKADGSLLTEADEAMQTAVQQFLQTHWPEFAFLGEESDPQAQTEALNAPTGCWILDPLDGTTNFAHGCPLFATSLALVIANRVVLGLVYDPIRDELFSALQGQGAFLNDQPLQCSRPLRPLAQCLALVDFKRLTPSLATALATQPPFASQRNIGAVVLDWCWLAAGRADLYLHGGQGLWDYAAGQLILAEAGGASATLQGEPVWNGTLQKRSAVCATSSQQLQLWLDYLHQAAG